MELSQRFNPVRAYLESTHRVSGLGRLRKTPIFKTGAGHDKATIRELQGNPDFAAEYLRAALEDADEPSVLLIALRRIAEARGGIAKVSGAPLLAPFEKWAAGLERESLYRALSVRGNPRLSTLVAVTKAVGLRLTAEAEP